MKYSKINNIVGWICFLIATTTYILTLEQSVSFWDCGEFIASALKMQVVHQPGAPLFLMIQRFFSIFAFGDVTKIAYFMNVGSAIASGATILFLFWTVTALAKKILIKGKEEISKANLISIMGAGIVGALAYTFSDSFWFSAVESEVYALSSLCTAVVFWAILKWEAVADEPRADRWLLLIAYIMGLSIGIHILNLLTIPAMAFVYYFRKTEKPTNVGIFKTIAIGVLILGFVQYGIIQYLVSFGAYFDLFFVNDLGLGFGTGVLFFTILLVGLLVFGINYSIKHKKKILNLALLSTTLIIFGYCSFAMILIRAQAKPNLNNSNPDNAFSFLSYLNREQYGDRPLLVGPNYNSVPKYEDDLSQPITIRGGKTYRKGETQYEVSGIKTKNIYGENPDMPDTIRNLQHEVFFPRMYSEERRHVNYYKDYIAKDKTDKNGNVVSYDNDRYFPSFVDNVGFFARYQVGLMYMRYFMWNFAGRQNEDQGQGSFYEGRALSGIKPIDALNLGDQTHLPPSIVDSKSYNRFFFLPLILGLLGAIWHFTRSPKDAGIIGLLFFMTGIAIVLYLNQKPLEPRERDYAYVGSFYAFAIWIGLAVLAIKEWVLGKLNAQTAAIGATAIALLCAPILMGSQGWDDHDRSGKMVAHDIAVSYMESCAPNAILFTYGDNDTYPLWYIQEVEGVRPDIRLVNLSLFDTDWYINGMRKRVHQSDPLPITMKESQYVSGERDVMYYKEMNIDGSVELKDIVDLLLSENPADKIPLIDGNKTNFIPTKNFKLTVNPQDVISTGTVPASEADKITPVMEWKFNKGYVTKGTLAMLDILAHNNWKRPVYFCTTVPGDQYNGLDNYLYNEGLAYRLLPLKIDSAIAITGEQGINIEPMYNHIMNKFKWGNIKNASYLDSQSADDVSIFNNMFNSLITNLIKAGRIEDAKKVVHKYDEVMPTKIYGIRTMMAVPTTAQNLYILGYTEKANALIKKSADYIRKEVTYLADVSKSKGTLVGGQNVQIGLVYGLEPMGKIAAKFGQAKLAKDIDKQYNELYNRFSQFFGPQQQ
jgi:pentatricopeptide repeat protein